MKNLNPLFSGILDSHFSMSEPIKADNHVWCRFTGPGRGDCLRFVGLPDKFDGTTTDTYGIPHGWCEYCWLSYSHHTLRSAIRRLSEEWNEKDKLSAVIGGCKCKTRCAQELRTLLEGKETK